MNKINGQGQPLIVVTGSDGYDNFNLGTDFAEVHQATIQTIRCRYLMHIILTAVIIQQTDGYGTMSLLRPLILQVIHILPAIA